MDKNVKNIQDEIYVRKDLSNSEKNAYYFRCGGYNVVLRNPRKYLSRERFEYIETDNIPTYSIRFETYQMATKFIEKCIADGTQNVDVCQRGPIVVIKPTNIDYQLWIELDKEDLCQKMVQVLRRQYVNNKKVEQVAELAR